MFTHVTARGRRGTHQLMYVWLLYLRRWLSTEYLLEGAICVPSVSYHRRDGLTLLLKASPSLEARETQ